MGNLVKKKNGIIFLCCQILFYFFGCVRWITYSQFCFFFFFFLKKKFLKKKKKKKKNLVVRFKTWTSECPTLRIKCGVIFIVTARFPTFLAPFAVSSWSLTEYFWVKTTFKAFFIFYIYNFCTIDLFVFILSYITACIYIYIYTPVLIQKKTYRERWSEL